MGLRDSVTDTKKQIEIEDSVNPWCGKGQTGERVGWTCRIGLEIQEIFFEDGSCETGARALPRNEGALPSGICGRFTVRAAQVPSRLAFSFRNSGH